MASTLVRKATWCFRERTWDFETSYPVGHGMHPEWCGEILTGHTLDAPEICPTPKPFYVMLTSAPALYVLDLRL